MIDDDDRNSLSGLGGAPRLGASPRSGFSHSLIPRPPYERAASWLLALLVDGLVHCACTQHAVHPEMIACLGAGHNSRRRKVGS